jgi:hypothetical protein
MVVVAGQQPLRTSPEPLEVCRLAQVLGGLTRLVAFFMQRVAVAVAAVVQARFLALGVLALDMVVAAEEGMRLPVLVGRV